MCAAGFLVVQASAREVPSKPQLLADFEELSAPAAWHGLQSERTDQRSTSGKYGLRFSVQEWREGLEPRPGLRFDPGASAGLADFSQFGKIAIDAWVEGDQPGKLGLSLRDANGEYSWTTHIVVEPHRWNLAELSIRDAAADCDVHRVKEVVLYALRPTNSFTLVVDNLRLLPKEKPPLAKFHLRQPNYRGWILPSSPKAEVEVAVASEEYGYPSNQLRFRLELQGGHHRVSDELKLRGNSGRIALPTSQFSPGDLLLKASVCFKGRELATQTWPVRCLTAAEVMDLKVYIDPANRLIVQGQPFFPIGCYGAVNEDQLAEIADSPFNCLLAYGTDMIPRERMTKFLDTMQAAGLKLVYCLNDVYPTATYFDGKDWEGVRGNDAIEAAIVEAYRSHPAVLAWYLNDELPHHLLPQLEQYYHRVRRQDPARPCFIVLCNRHDLPYFPHTTDILGVDPYPIPKDPITRVNDFVLGAREAVRGTQPVWLVPQAFAWYQYNSKDPDRGHTPTEEELRTGRAPTREEERCMTYLGLIHGASGLIYYCYYDLRVLPQYQAMWSWMKAIATEVKTLTPALLSTEPTETWSQQPKTSPVQARLLRHQQTLYLLAANPSKASCRARFSLPTRSGSGAEVLFENRQVPVVKGTFEDDFPALAVHVYALSSDRRGANSIITGAK